MYLVILPLPQVLPIWEGTTNILSLDVLRAIEKTDGEVMKAFMTHCGTILTTSNATTNTATHVRTLLTAIDQLTQYVTEHLPKASNKQLRARELAFTVARIYVGKLTYY